MKKIGMIGIGLMGHGIATNVRKAGYPLGILEHPGNQPLDSLIAQGVTTYQSPRALAADSEVIILCVTGSPQVEAVLFEPDGVLEGLKEGTVVIDCSTAIPSSTVRIAQQIVDKGGRFLDSPMTRTPKEAAEGRLNLLVGSDRALFDEMLPLLRSFAENVTHAGPVGSGHRMKLLHNYVSLGQVALISEAAACAAKADIDPAVLVEVLAKGGGGGAALDRLKPFLLDQDPTALRFTLSNANKDLGYYTLMAKDGEAAHEIADAVATTFERFAALAPNRYVSELASLLNNIESDQQLK
ncbi:NAD(P)-dependent oxidoreductase [Pollutimonas bauzanensis]|jgi:3-hydroxyisobutyrate dehydrogenase-like beta-hydroxyacid dehydrogenase|uniref:NAD(P)-dependent oxidoreductase n=1 Tax=Pollutimonas bauzanensis TaxID=658167 RepID=UPI00333E42FD